MKLRCYLCRKETVFVCGCCVRPVCEKHSFMTLNDWRCCDDSRCIAFAPKKAMEPVG